MALFGHDPAPIRHKRIAPAANPDKVHAFNANDKRHAPLASINSCDILAIQLFGGAARKPDRFHHRQELASGRAAYYPLPQSAYEEQAGSSVPWR
jgi:hypothetical protein